MCSQLALILPVDVIPPPCSLNCFLLLLSECAPIKNSLSRTLLCLITWLNRAGRLIFWSSCVQSNFFFFCSVPLCYAFERIVLGSGRFGILLRGGLKWGAVTARRIAALCWQCMTVSDSVWQCLTVSDSARQCLTVSDTGLWLANYSNDVFQRNCGTLHSRINPSFSAIYIWCFTKFGGAQLCAVDLCTRKVRALK